ncbi:MAG: AtpZ/AtpI family protein [Bacteroidota bacterium]
MKNRFRKNKNRFDAFIRYSSLGFEMMAMIAIGTFLGYKIDQWLGNDFRWFTLLMMVFSVIGSVIYFIRKILR